MDTIYYGAFEFVRFDPGYTGRYIDDKYRDDSTVFFSYEGTPAIRYEGEFFIQGRRVKKGNFITNEDLDNIVGKGRGR